MLREILSDPPHIYQMLQKVFGASCISTCFKNHLANGVCDNSKSCDICGEWFIGDKCLITFAIYHIAVIVQTLSNQITSDS